ncbi:MAG: IS110 family RNA-guided transposase [Candidatus Hodarchaeales archaeon]|jgi:transposase
MKNRKISNVHRNLNRFKKYPLVVSLDIHKRSTYIYAVDTYTGEILADKNIIGSYKSVLKTLKTIKPKKQIIVLFEAGNPGFSPYRFFTGHKYACQIIAPSSIPKKGKRRKTDRDDAVENLNYHMSGNLSYVHVPSIEEEDAREFMRFRYNHVWKLTQQKQRINALIKRNGLSYELTKSPWTKTHYRWLRIVKLPTLARQVMNIMLDRLEDLYEQLETIDEKLEKLFERNTSYRHLRFLYEQIPGIGRVVSMTLVLEEQDLSRFRNPNALMNYTGLIPKKNSSGEKDPHLRITKAGNKFLRLALVCSAKFYRDRRLLMSSRRLSRLPIALGQFVEKCQTRLHDRYKFLREKGKNSNKVKVAIARELSGFLWELVVRVNPELPIRYQYSKAA